MDEHRQWRVAFQSQKKTFTNYSTPDGLPGPDLTGWGACFKSQSGEMFFGGFSGATAFVPETVVGTSYTPFIVLTDFRLFGNSVEIGRGSPLKQSISFTRDLTLSHGQNVFSITFAALSFTNPATNRYRYMLEGLEHDWNVAGSDRRQATLYDLAFRHLYPPSAGCGQRRPVERARRGASH